MLWISAKFHLIDVYRPKGSPLQQHKSKIDCNNKYHYVLSFSRKGNLWKAIIPMVMCANGPLIVSAAWSYAKASSPVLNVPNQTLIPFLVESLISYFCCIFSPWSCLPCNFITLVNSYDPKKCIQSHLDSSNIISLFSFSPDSRTLITSPIL